MLTTSTPINSLKAMEERLALWAKVFEASSESIMITDGERRIITVNRAFRAAAPATASRRLPGCDARTGCVPTASPTRISRDICAPP